MTAVVTLITAVTLSYRSNSFLCCYVCDCGYVRSLGTLSVNSLIWDGGSIHDERRTRHSTQIEFGS